MLISVELSLRVSSAAENAATGPEVNAITAAWGTYATVNIASVTPRLSDIVAGSLLLSGRHNALCDAK